MSLLDLNDDCLEKIFDRLPILELCSLVQTCSRMNRCGIRFFARKHKTVHFNTVAKNPTLGQARKFFRTFGSVIFDLRINLGYTHSTSIGSRIIDALIRHCTSLKALKIRSYSIPDNQDDITKMGLLFSNLIKLHLTEVFIDTCDGSIDNWDSYITPNGNIWDCFSNCRSLIDLTVKECFEFKRTIFESHFPKLQHLKYFLREGYLSYSVDGFFLRHKNLKSFSLQSKDEDYYISFVPVLTATCKNLEKLEFSLVSSGYSTGELAKHNTSLKSLARLQNLRELKVFFGNIINPTNGLSSLSDSLEVLDLSYSSYDHAELIQVVAQLRNLRIFRLHYCYGLGDINLISELKQLTELSLRYVEAERFDLITIVDGLTNLTKINFFVNDFKISKKTYLRLVNIVDCRPNAMNRVLTLRCPTAEEFDIRATVKHHSLPYKL